MIWPATILLFTQIATVWQALRISVVRRGLRIAATVLFVLSMIAAVANLFAAKNSAFVAFAFLAATVLYFMAPFSIVQHVGYRRTVDQETMLGALATYLFIGIAFAFAYRLVGAAQASPFFGARGDGTVSQGEVTLSIADVDLVHVSLRALVTSVRAPAPLEAAEGGPR